VYISEEETVCRLIRDVGPLGKPIQNFSISITAHTLRNILPKKLNRKVK
jgi:hypothetical protein